MEDRTMMRTAVVLALVLAALANAAPAAHANGILVSETANRRGAPAVTLEAHTVKAKITDQVAEVTVEQVFRSRSRRQLEGTYVFPLPEGAVVSDFAMTMGGTMVKGEVVEARKARAIYERIVRRKKDPGLLEYLGRGLYRARVFPIEPGKALTIRLSFQQVLRDDAGTLEFRYPLATDRMNGRPVTSATVTVDIESGVNLKAIYSTTHRVEIKREGEAKARATYERTGARQQEDFLLYIGRSARAVGFSMLSHKAAAQDGTFMAVVAPQNEVADADRAGRDIVFVLDTSGSMSGEKIVQARRALVQGVQTLAAKDRFNIIRFSSASQSFRDGLLPATKETRAAALAWIQRIEAHGATDIHGALTQAMSLAQAERRCMIVFLTDGRPTVGIQDAGQLLASLAQANRHGARVFTFGVGYDLDVSLLDRVAEATGGARDYVAPNEDIELVTSRFLHKVSHPVLTNVTLRLGSGVHDVYPREIGDLFAGSQVVLFGRYREAGERTVVLEGSLDGKPVRHEFKALLRASEGPGYLQRLWGHRKVAFLLDEIRLHGAKPELTDEVVRLATKHAIVTPYTSGLVVEDHVETDNDLPFEESLGQSDAPFEGPVSDGSIGIGGGAGGAFPGRGGSRDLGTGGGSSAFWRPVPTLSRDARCKAHFPRPPARPPPTSRPADHPIWRSREPPPRRERSIRTVRRPTTAQRETHWSCRIGRDRQTDRSRRTGPNPSSPASATGRAAQAAPGSRQRCWTWPGRAP